jgi:hypothetical protein
MIMPRHTFIVRIWFERETHNAESPYLLRGSLHSTSQEQVEYFQSLEALVELLSAHIERGASTNLPPSSSP